MMVERETIEWARCNRICIPLKTQEGIALLLVLWVLTILTVIVFSFSYMGRTEALSALSFKEGIEKKFLAEAGIERGIMEISYRNANVGQTTILEGKEVWKTDGTMYRIQTDTGYFAVGITDETGKIDINSLTDSSGIILKNLLMNSGVQEEDANTIVDSTLDWKDKTGGAMHRLHGAGDDYYMSLPNPYKAKHDNFDTVEELLLVKGMTYEILYGDGNKKGLIDFLTVYANTPQINVNAAPKEVLEAIPGITPDIANNIISLRGDQTQSANLQQLIASVPPPFNALVSLTQSNTFTIDAAGFKGAENHGYAIRATVTLSADKKNQYLYYKSPAEVRHDRYSSD
jgi:general secretion pathway protein K